MSKGYNAGLQQRLQDFVKKTGSLGAAGQALGYSSATLSTYLASKYKGRVDEVERKLSEFFTVEDRRAQRPAHNSPAAVDPDAYKPTSISQHIYNNIDLCRANKSIFAAIGMPGVGKSMAATQFCLDNPHTTIYIKLSPIIGVHSRFIRRLARELNINDTGDLGRIREEIGLKLADTNLVLVLDEAQHLRYTALEEIREWTQFDRMTKQRGCGLVLVGNPHIKTRMHSKGYSQYDQQDSRMREEFYSFQQIQPEDVMMIFTGLESAGSDEEVEFLLQACRTPKGIRAATYIWNDAVDDEDISVAHLRTIARKRGILVA